MSSRIADDIIDALQHCRLKAYFLLRGEQGSQSGYERLLIEQRANLERKIIEKIGRDYSENEVATDLALSAVKLREGAAFVLGARLEDDHYAVRFDALRKINGRSLLGDFQYEPVLFCAEPRVRAFNRQKLATRAVLLARFQGTFPSGGTVYLGRDCSRTSIRFGSTLTAAENLLRDAERLQRAEAPPKLLLNDHCRICAFRDRCRDQAIRQDNLSLLRGIGEKAIKSYARKGILTLTQLAHTFRPRRRGKRADTPLTRRDHALHALAIRDQTIYVLGATTIPTAPVRIYVDMEGDPEDRFTYLIGLVVCDGERVERYSFWADDRKGESEICAGFLDVVARYKAPHLYAYGNYERTFIARMRPLARRRRRIDSTLAALTNVLTIIYPHFYFPTYSNGLKEVAGCLGCRWTEPEASGIESIVWRKNWERTGDASWKTKLIQYNLEDCDALRRVCAFLSEAPNSNAITPTSATPRVASVAQLDKLARTVTWSKFVHADFEFVNKMAFFDYQRRHVFTRSKVTAKKRRSKKGRRRWQNRDLRVTHQVEITASRCPDCKSKHIVPLDPKRRPKGLQTRRKYAFDLAITPGAIRRKVIEFRAIAYRCTNCEGCFTPETYQRLTRYFHGFMSWFAYQHVAHRLGVKSLAGRPSGMEKASRQKPRNPPRGGGNKTAKRLIHEERIVKASVPPGSRFKGYESFVVQDLVLRPHVVRYRRERWRTPDGRTVIAPLPCGVSGHFGAELRRFVLVQHHQGQVTLPRLLAQLRGIGIDVSKRQLMRMLIDKQEAFIEEARDVLRAGLETASWISVDDTGARRKGRNGICTQIGNDHFTWFGTTSSKSRLNFLDCLRAGHADYVVNQEALAYMRERALSGPLIARLAAHADRHFADAAAWMAHLQRLGIAQLAVTPNPLHIATEGAVFGSIKAHGFLDKAVILSDDAGQFDVGRHALCWVHAERLVHKLDTFAEHERRAQQKLRALIWLFYRSLLAYKRQPSPGRKLEMSARFDRIFKRRTGFVMLDRLLRRLHANKAELLTVLDRPEIPLHTNGSENDIRCQVTKRKISGGTRSDTGRDCRDAFLGLAKTCTKLGIAFWDYLGARLKIPDQPAIPSLPDIVKHRCQSA